MYKRLSNTRHGIYKKKNEMKRNKTKRKTLEKGLSRIDDNDDEDVLRIKEHYLLSSAAEESRKEPGEEMAGQSI